MRLIYLILLILTNAITAFSTTVIIDPYRDIDYETLNVYDYNEVEDPCPEMVDTWRLYGP